MRSFLATRALAGLLLWGSVAPASAQVMPPAPPASDTLRKYEKPTVLEPKKAWYQGKLVRASLVPALLIGYGISTIKDNGLYSSYDAKRDVREAFPSFRTRVDDVLLIAPYLELGAAALLGVESRDDRLNTLLIIGKAEAIMLGSVYGLKYATNMERPNGERYAFPSGHTAQAFLAASIVHTELRAKSQWYGIGAYTIATGVGALRMLNNKHWQSDVFAGAGLGILSAHLAYLSHRNRWGRPPRLSGLRFSPVYYAGATGLALIWQPH